VDDDDVDDDVDDDDDVVDERAEDELLSPSLTSDGGICSSIDAVMNTTESIGLSVLDRSFRGWEKLRLATQELNASTVTCVLIR